MARHSSTRTGTTTKPQTHTLLQHILRILQFLSALVSLILFSLRISKIIKLYGRATRSNGAVEGILAAAVLYTLIAMALQLGIKGTGSKVLRLAFIVLDIWFIAAFIVVAVLTSPKRHGSSAPCTKSLRVNSYLPTATNCSLPWGTFIAAILSSLLHTATAAFNGLKDRRRESKNEHAVAKNAHHTRNSLDSADAQNGYHASRV